MNSTTIPTTLLYFSPSPAASTESSSKRQAHNPRHVQLKLDKRQNCRNFLSKSIKCTQNRGIRNPTALASCLAATEAPPSKAAELVADKLKRLVLEFRSLAEPIDRVKRLLHYAARLPPYNESTRKPESRVPGCSTQVWVEAEMDELGRMRFRADSDSEISKGFCSCLIWMLDGAEAAEVLEVKTRDLEDVNVGVYGKVNSRVNTWHNVLLAMQRKTQALVAEREGKRPLEALPSLLASANEHQFFHPSSRQ
ncbi:sufE-like protein 2, chloroplastic [Prunus dulcis]|uniref:sufE-like protein 2, chloroplastic n=1 Tax=Prunus dulcis TaxID=3755 RepID=UPI001481E9A2|nr:sufE-like protein 2, chloroplastic [Prunus dulcis]XP_034201595.1 sufE-like protein 2, chloroplastic [Prunus dulcis]